VLIEAYFLHLERVLASCPQLEQISLTKERRGPHIGFVQGTITVSGAIQLFVMEFVQTEPRLFKRKYRYHCHDGTGTSLFRYDNAPHHVTDTFPHHKHIFSPSSGETVIAAQPPTLEALLEEVVRLAP